MLKIRQMHSSIQPIRLKEVNNWRKIIFINRTHITLTNLLFSAYVDQALYWEASSLYPAIKAVIYPIVKSLDTKLNESNLKLVYDKLILLNEDLGRSSFIAGDELTIADLSLLAVWTGIEATGFWKTEQLGNVHAWCKRLQDSGRITNWNEIAIGSAKAYGDLIRSKLNSN